MSFPMRIKVKRVVLEADWTLKNRIQAYCRIPRTFSLGIVNVGVVDVRYPYDEHSHLSDGSVDHAGWYVNHGAGSNFLLLSIEDDFA